MSNKQMNTKIGAQEIKVTPKAFRPQVCNIKENLDEEW